MNTVTKYGVIFVVFAILIAVVAGLMMRAKDTGPRTAPPEPSVNVVLSVVKLTTLPDAILLPASVEAAKLIRVAAEASGVVEWVGVEEGSQVREGQEIAKVDMRTLQAQLDQAKADHELALSDFGRVDQLYKGKIASEEQYQAAKVGVAVREAQLDMAQVMFAKRTVSAPVSGRLNRRYIERGEYVKPGDLVAEIVQAETVKVVIDVPEKDINYVSLGTILGIITDGTSEFALPRETQATDLAEAIKQAVADKKVILGAVSYKSLVADAKTRTFRVEVKTPNADLKLLPGMIVRVVLLRRMVRDAVAVPLVAVVPRDGRAAAYVEENGRARERTVTLGVTDGRNIQVTSGLAVGDKLIVEGQRQLKDGTLLKVVEPGSKSVPAAGDAANSAGADTAATSTDGTSGQGSSGQ